MPIREGIYGLLAEFDTPTELVVAAKTAYDAGWRRMDCYSPYPVEEAAEAIGFHRNYVPLVCLIGGLIGLAAMFLMETWVSVLAYPLNIAGRPLFSWPAFVIPAGRAIGSPGRGKEIAIEAGNDDDKSLEPHAGIDDQRHDEHLGRIYSRAAQPQ